MSEKYWERRCGELVMEIMALREKLNKYEPPPKRECVERKGWERPEHNREFHYFVNGASLCGHYLGFWPDEHHPLSHPENCPECVQKFRAGETNPRNPFL